MIQNLISVFTPVSYALRDVRICPAAHVLLYFAFCAKPFPRRTESAILIL